MHEDEFELSVTMNFALRGNKDPLIGDRPGSSRDYLSSYTEGRKSSLTRYPSQESLGQCLQLGVKIFGGFLSVNPCISSKENDLLLSVT